MLPNCKFAILPFLADGGNWFPLLPSKPSPLPDTLEPCSVPEPTFFRNKSANKKKQSHKLNIVPELYEVIFLQIISQ